LVQPRADGSFDPRLKIAGELSMRAGNYAHSVVIDPHLRVLDAVNVLDGALHGMLEAASSNAIRRELG
jgi:hypothetical protein